MASWPSATRVVLGVPAIEHVDGKIVLTPEIVNVSGVPMRNLQCTDIALGSARRLSPPHGYPVVLGTLNRGSVGQVGARFAAAGLIIGAQYLLTLRGSYVLDGVAQTLALTRYVQIPPPSRRPPAALLRARVASSTSTDFWNYQLLNDESGGSPQHIATFSLSLAAPITVTGIPLGWTVETDSLSYVLWTAAEYAPPYPHQVAPGHALAGFQLMSPRTRSEAAAGMLAAWDHAADTAGLVTGDYALVPYRYA